MLPRPVWLLKRHGLTLLLTAALVAVYVLQTVPALQERAQLRAARAEAEAELQRQRDALQQGSLWLRGASTDPFVRERFLDAYRRSPEVPGPYVQIAPPVVPDETMGEMAGEPSGVTRGAGQALPSDDHADR
jgi:hypothetical protein